MRWWLRCASSAALLGLLLAGCRFECFCFLVKSAEASWLLEVSFYDIFSYRSGSDFVSLGTPWESIGAAGRTRVGPEPEL